MTNRLMLTAAEVGALSWRDYGGDEMERETTVTGAFGHNFKAGDVIMITTPDLRWWRRLIFWVMRWGKPTRTKKLTVSQSSGTTLTF